MTPAESFTPGPLTTPERSSNLQTWESTGSSATTRACLTTRSRRSSKAPPLRRSDQREIFGAVTKRRTHFVGHLGQEFFAVRVVGENGDRVVQTGERRDRPGDAQFLFAQQDVQSQDVAVV